MIESSQSDLELVREYARTGSEAAFSELARRHVNLVFSVALRQVRDRAVAEDVTQSVFLILARKAASLGEGTIVPGWLCRTARFVAARANLMNQRRERREQEAFMRQESTMEQSADQWREIEPHLEAAMAELGARDHDAVVMRFFEGRPFSEVAAAMGATEAGAKMRVARALEKLRKAFTKRGITISASLLAAVVSAHSVQAAPVSLAASVTAAAVKGTTVTASTLTLVESSLKYMAYANIKSAALVSAAVLVLGAATTATIQTFGSGAEPPKKSASAAAAKPDYSSPEATLKSLIAALGKADENEFAQGCTTEWAAGFRARNATKTPEENKQQALAQAKAFSQFIIQKREEISPTETHMWVAATGESPKADMGDRKGIMVFRKVGKDWKFDGMRQ